MTLKAIAPSRPQQAVKGAEAPDDSASGAVRFGWLVLFVFFGGFGTWAATAPLNGAVIGEAVVKVDGNRKSVQHLEGGIVKEIRVREGERISEGDVVIVLDEGSAQADLEVLDQQRITLLAIQARLEAEISGADDIIVPAHLSERWDDESVRAAMASQQAELGSRRAARTAEQATLERRISQLEEQAKGDRAQATTFKNQLDSVVAEEESLADLVKKGLVTRPRILQLQRTAEGLRGQMEAALASLAQTQQAIEETRTRIDQLNKQAFAEAVQMRSEVESKLSDITPRLRTSSARRTRTEIRSPYSGTVVGLNVFSVGGVIGPGERLLDVVPDETSLVVEARIAVEDIAEIRPGMTAEVLFTSYKQRLTPRLHGSVREVSADRLVDDRTQIPYYLTLLEVDPDDLSNAPQIQLYPGMPATVMITTIERTALDYLVGPLVESFHSSFRQK
ncbi:MAG: HlyD family type I secretion periplasmic adaptor subunit [Mesorhizobium sp.]